MKHLIPQESFGVVEVFVTTSIFFSPNILLLLPFFRDKIFLFIVYEFLLIYLLISVLTHKQSIINAIEREKYKKE